MCCAFLDVWRRCGSISVPGASTERGLPKDVAAHRRAERQQRLQLVTGPWSRRLIQEGSLEAEESLHEQELQEGEVEGEGGVPVESEEHGGRGQSEEAVHDTPSAVIADMLLGFLVLDVLLIHLVKWPDPQVRSYMYKMISSTMSIFCAVLINEAFLELIFDLITRLPVPAKLHVRRGLILELVVGFFAFGIFLSALNILCYKYRHRRNRVYAAQVIFAHLAAFAGILTFESFQTAVKHSFAMVCGVVIFAVVFLFACRTLTRMFRVHVAMRYRKAFTYENLSEATTDGRWREAVEEGEDDATALVLSFLTQQVIAQSITGEFQPVEDINVVSPTATIRQIFGAAAAFAILLMVVTVVRARHGRKKSLKALQRTGASSNHAMRRGLEWVQTFLAMSMGWCLLRAGVWTIGSLISVTEAMTQVLNAFVMSGVVVVLTIALDKCADGLQQCHNGQSSNLRQNSNGSEGDDEGAEGNSEDEEGQEDDTSAAVPNQRWGTQLEKSLRAIISGFGLAVAICWEHAFAAAGETMIETTKVVESNAALAKAIMAAFAGIIVLPAWLAYIVPMARKSWYDHQASINMEALQAGSNEDDDDVKLAALEVAAKALQCLPDPAERKEAQDFLTSLQRRMGQTASTRTRTLVTQY